MFCAIIAVLAIAELSLDLGYYVRAFVSLYIGKWFQKRVNITDTVDYYGICTTRDADGLFTHMNNSRYIRLTDAAKFNFCARVGFTDKFFYFNVYMVVGAHTVRYRRPIKTFDLYKIETKVLYINENIAYFEHKFVTLKDGFVRAIVLSRTHIMGVVDRASLMGDISNADTLTKMPEEIRQWEEALQTMGGKIRQKGHS